MPAMSSGEGSTRREKLAGRYATAGVSVAVLVWAAVYRDVITVILMAVMLVFMLPATWFLVNMAWAAIVALGSLIVRAQEWLDADA